MVPRFATGVGLALALAAAPSSSPPSPPPAAPAQLLPAGSFVERDTTAGDTQLHPIVLTREITAGESHVSAVALEEGQLLDVLVEPQGIDVAAILTEPDGLQAVKAAESINPIWVERVLWIARASGSHTLTVRANTTRPAGRYTVRLAPPRPASADDERRVAAQRDVEQVVEWRVAGTWARPGLAPDALRRLQSALEGFQAAGDRRGEATALTQRADLELELNRHNEAVATAGRTLALSREVGDRGREAVSLQQIGWGSFRQGDLSGGLGSLQEAVRVSREASNAWAEATYLNDVATLHRRNGDAEKAITYFQQAIERARVGGNRQLEAYALNNLGISYKDLGDYDKALASYEQAVSAFRDQKDAQGEAGTYNNIGTVYRLMGEDDRARDSFGRYLAHARKENPGGGSEARALNNLSAVSHRLGDYDEALEQARRSLEIRRRTNDRSGQASSLHNIGRSLNETGRSEEALAALQEALRIRRELGERYPEADTLMEIATVERDRGRLSEAREQAEAAILLTEDLRSAVTSPELRASFVAAQQDKYGLYVDLLMRLHERDATAGHAAAALEASERAKARVLLDALVEAKADIRQGVAPALLARERSLQKQLSDASARLSSALTRGSPPEAVVLAQQELTARSEEYRQLQSRIRLESPRYAALTQPVPASLDVIRRDLLDEDTVLLEFHLGDERSFLWAVTRSGLESVALPPRAEIEAASRKVHELVTARRHTRVESAARESDRALAAESRALSQVLFARLARRLASDWKTKRLVVVAPGALAYLALAALPPPGEQVGRLLIEDHEIVFAPSASVLIEMRKERARVVTASVAVLADPVFDASDPRVDGGAKGKGASAGAMSGGLTRALDSLGSSRFSRLPFSRREADGIARLAPPGASLKATDFAASRALIARGALDHYGLVHFATHGLLDSQHPDLSGLVLSLVDETGNPQDGFLRMHEIYNLQLPARLVVLSACQTALGREIRGEGLMALTRGFMYAGAASVVASLWQVDDESTAELMKRFYRGMLSEDRRPAEALRRAQLEMAASRRWSAPFYWAGFVLQGEWR